MIFLKTSLGLWWLSLQILQVATLACQRNQCSAPSPSPPTNCLNPRLFSAHDDCDCLHWYCDQSPNVEQQSICPPGWKSYHNGKGTFCMTAFHLEVSWRNAQERCTKEYNSNLLNIRRLESFTEDDLALHQQMLDDLAVITDRLTHWTGLHIQEGKLYWDNQIPLPDRDYTSAIGSIVNFNGQDWVAINDGRECVSYTSRDITESSSVKLQPEYCWAGIPFVCYKEISEANTASYYKPLDELLCGGESGWSGNANSGLCYNYFPDILPFAQAQQECAGVSAYLADPRYQINQYFLTGVLSSLLNGSAPLRLHVGMSGSNQSLNVIFDSGETLQRSEMKNASILSLPHSWKRVWLFQQPTFCW
ncbi:hypothetical protein EB796_010623 [Bugula neritina]|uniref:C-type lectin domain-containing protein n=1 Tax=Bugula neritina TaxID=10212 RepID=A0A7J7JYW1_BUGNE|nr:hypothetical protein EB796_010623 [Bugula neritina]